MLTKSLMLSCLLVGLGVVQNPISASTQSRSIPSVTASAAFIPTTEPPYPWDKTHCDLSSEEQAKLSEIVSRIVQFPAKQLASCFSEDSISEATECQALHELADLSPQCFTPPDGEPANSSENDDSDDIDNVFPFNLCRDYTDKSDTSPPDIGRLIEASEAGLDILKVCGRYLAFKTVPMCKEFKKSVQWCQSCPEAPGCQDLWWLLANGGIEFWESSRVNDTSCLSSSPDLAWSLLRHYDPAAVESRPTHEDKLVQRDPADEANYTSLEEVYDDGDLLSGPEERMRDIINEVGLRMRFEELKRHLCEGEPKVRGSQLLQAVKAQESRSKSANIGSDSSDEIPDESSAM